MSGLKLFVLFLVVVLASTCLSVRGYTCCLELEVNRLRGSFLGVFQLRLEYDSSTIRV